MRNIGVIAVNEYTNLLRSKLILVIGAIYVLLFVKVMIEIQAPGNEAYSQTLSMIHMMGVGDSDYYTSVLLWNIGYVLWYYGAFFGMVLGVYTVAAERYNNTLNTLTVKPLYRDTILNGKLLGCSLFILSIFVLSILIYTGYIQFFWGGSFISLAEGYFVRLPIIALISLLYVLFFFSLSMLISLIVTDLAFALILSMMVKCFFVDALSVEISGKLTTLLGMNFNTGNPFHDFIPNGIMSSIFKKPIESNNILRPSNDLILALSESMPNVVKLLLYVVILVIISYIIFLRRDVA
ncbi:ABC transporter permease [Methanocella arvoryzae]|uniref:ABC-type transport system, permease component n=1 Tax=Methanocella arvoryzae (strain DSM 22066 / NBRC 105507 / MRE50) TaxID=351160 RepID=Q0W607_METAR|nr:ABC transporter permease subunit [Methanocella arvoryzae]CAJ36186.1 hypothetical protein RCIX815 [Methanocella arvoryzae MRE50]